MYTVCNDDGAFLHQDSMAAVLLSKEEAEENGNVPRGSIDARAGVGSGSERWPLRNFSQQISYSVALPAAVETYPSYR